MLTRKVRPARFLLATLLMATAALMTTAVAACSSGGDSGAAQAPPPPALSDGPLQGPLVVFASVPLTDTLQEVQRDLSASKPALQIRYTFAGSSVLTQQLEQKVPADVIASGDQASMQKLVAAKLIETPAVFARNTMQIAVAKGNPKGITKLADLTRPGVKVALLDAGTPAGRDVQRVFDNQILTVTPVAAPLEAKDAVQSVSSGKADATVLYVTDVAAAAGTVAGVAIPDNQNVVSSYRIAVVKAAKNREAAQAYVDYVLNGPGQKLIKAHGFLAP